MKVREGGVIPYFSFEPDDPEPLQARVDRALTGEIQHRVKIFATPKSKKALALAEFLLYLPTGISNPPINDDIPYEHLFVISSDDRWYGDILVYLCTQKFGPNLSIYAHRWIRHQAPRYLLIDDILYR